MIRTIPKWTVSFLSQTKLITQLTISKNSYTEVFRVLSELDRYVSVNRIVIEKKGNAEQSTQELAQNSQLNIDTPNKVSF